MREVHPQPCRGCIMRLFTYWSERRKPDSMMDRFGRRLRPAEFRWRVNNHVRKARTVLSALCMVALLTGIALAGLESPPGPGAPNPSGEGGGPGPGGFEFGGPWQWCATGGENVPPAALEAIDQRYCLLQGLQRKGTGLCVVWPDAPGQPTLIDGLDGLYNKAGVYCPNNFGGSTAATICGDGRILDGKQPCG